MPLEFICQVQTPNGSAVLESVRSPLDQVRTQQWLSVQTAEALPGQRIVIIAVEANSLMPNGWPTPVSLKGADGAPGAPGQNATLDLTIGSNVEAIQDLVAAMLVGATYDDNTGLITLPSNGGGGSTGGGGTRSTTDFHGTDNWENAPILLGANGTTPLTDLTAFTAQAGQPTDSRLGNVWWQWLCPTSGNYNFSTIGSRENFGPQSPADTLMQIWTGNGLTSLVLVADNDDAATGSFSEVVFAAVAGTTYSISVSQYSSGGSNPVISAMLTWSAV